MTNPNARPAVRSLDQFTVWMMTRLTAGLADTPGMRLAIVASLAVLIGLVDYTTDYEISFKMLYMLPIALAVAWFGLRGGLLVSFTSFAFSIGGDLANNAPVSLVAVSWNALIGLFAFIALTFFLHTFMILYRESEQLVLLRTAALENASAERDRLQRELLEISERERNAIGHELHDALGQHLTGTAMVAQTEAARLAANRESAVNAWRIVKLIEEAIAQVRQLAQGLLLAEVKPEELSAKLEELAFATQRQGTVACAYHVTGEPRVASASVASHLFRIAQEALRNATRHAGAASIDLHFNSHPNGLELVIRDTGIGLQAAPTSRPGMGLRIMRHRAELIGGRLTIRSAPNEGTEVVCVIPLAPLQPTPTPS